MIGETTISDNINIFENTFEGFFTTVSKVYITEEDIKSNKEFKIKKNDDVYKIYGNDENFAENIYAPHIGVIDIFFNGSTRKAYPFDKNNMTLPIEGETVVVFHISDFFYYLPCSSNTVYPNYRRDYVVYETTKERIYDDAQSNVNTIKETSQSGIPNIKQSNLSRDENIEYKINTKVKFLKPKTGDTIITGRVGQSIRFSEFFLTDNKTSSPSIFISNKKSTDSENKKIGELIEEDINKDGSSIYIVSEKTKVPFKEVVKKQKVAFKDFPNNTALDGNQIYINSDRVFISSKAEEVIIFGAKNTGVITDGRFSVDCKNGMYVHSENDDVTLHTINGKNIFLNSDSSGKIYLGKNKGEGGAGADVQKMVLGGELISILEEILDAINQQVYLTPSGPTATGPTNSAKFNSIKNKLNTILSGRNFLSKQ
jgi:hypothetical protein